MKVYKEWEARALFYKNMSVLLISVVALTRALWTILSSRSRGTDTTTRRFASGIMVILFSLELLECVVWLVGVSFAGTANGAAPWARRDPALIDRWCYSVGLLNYWLHYCMVLWQLVLAYSIWAWVAKRESVSVLNRRLLPSLIAVLAVSCVLSVVPIVEQDLGLWANTTCYLQRTWRPDGTATASLIVCRIIVIPGVSLLILFFNISTVCRLRREVLSATQSGLSTAHSGNRLQIRLVLVAVAFVTINMVQCIPSYLKGMSFTVDFATRWLFAVGFVDVLAFTYDWPVFKQSSNHRTCATHLLPCFSWRSHKAEQEGRKRPASLSVWETMIPRSLFLPSLPRANMSTDHCPRNTSSMMMRTRARLRLPARRGTTTSSTTSSSSSSLGRRHVLCTTFDMHHAQSQDVTDGLAKWVPREGYHVYAILVQRCRALNKLRHAIQQHLGGNAKYQLCACAEVGCHHIPSSPDKLALMLFARTVDVESGAFKVVGSSEQPLSMAAARSSYKGLVSVAFRYYDMTVAVLGIDLPSQAHVRAADARDKLVSSMLHSVRLQADHDLYDTHLQWHHVVLMGSFSYGMQPSSPSSTPADVLGDVAHASHSHQISRYDKIDAIENPRQEADSEYKEVEEVDLEKHVVAAQKGISDWVCGTDVLTQRLQHGQALHGFREQHIQFLPTYKWKCRSFVDDRCDVHKLTAAFMTERIKAQITVYPSYADRILVRSLPALAGRLLLGPYEMCEEGSLAGSSDHRPVSQAVTLLVDTTKPLSCLWADTRSAPLTSDVSEHDTTAHAMATAAARRQSQKHIESRPPTFSAASYRGLPAGAYGPHTTIGRRSGSSSGSSQNTDRITAILVTLSLRSFSFQFCGFKWLEAPPSRLYGPRKASSTHHDAQKTEQLADHEEPPRHVSLGRGASRDSSYDAASSDGSNFPAAAPSSALLSIAVSTKAWLREVSSSSGDAAAVACEKRDALRTPGFIQEVVITYPLPCEDPLLLLRRRQAFEHGLLNPHHKHSHNKTGDSSYLSSDARIGRSQSAPITGSTGDNPPAQPPQRHRTHTQTPLSSEASCCAASATDVRRGHMQSGVGVSCRATAAHKPEKEYPLQNTYRIPWRQCLLSKGARGGDGADMSEGDEFAVELDILTLGVPSKIPTHALIKFMGSGGRQLGQGVMCVSGCPARAASGSGHLQSLVQRTLMRGNSSDTTSGTTDNRTHAVNGRDCGGGGSGDGGGDGGCGVGSAGRGGWRRHVVDLSVGGDLRGSVGMDVNIKTRTRVSVRVPSSPLSAKPSSTPPPTPTPQQQQQHQQQQQQQPHHLTPPLPAPAASAAGKR